MNDNIINSYNAFQNADFDHDIVGICKALVDWMKVLRLEAPNAVFPNANTPLNFYKQDPHLPRMELRKNLRDGVNVAVKYQEEENFETKIVNIYVMVLAATYIYHLPTENMVKASLDSKEFTREDSKEMLLADNMSPNWLQEPSGKDFSAIML